MQCGGLNELPSPVTSAALNRRESAVRRVRDDLRRDIRGSLYFPFIFYRPGEIRARQAYLAKFPAALVAALPELSAVFGSAGSPQASRPFNSVRRAVGMPRLKDPELRKALEQWAVKRAKAYYRKLGATRIKELGKPYDLIVYGLGPDRHVEVKGSSVQAVAVELTVDEVGHARNYPFTDLVVVDEIQWRRDGNGGYITEGGKLRIARTWQPHDDDLSVTRYRYDLPPAMHIPGGP
jgi:hypothetical protein